MGSRETEERMYDYWLSCVKGIPPRKKCMLRERMKSGRAAYYIEETQLARLEFLNGKEKEALRREKGTEGFKRGFEKMERSGIRFIPYYDPEYPMGLLQLPDFPFALYVKGGLPSAGTKSAALVGARKCSPYGEKYAIEYGRALAEAGVQVVSGMAKGIDGAGQRGALTAGGRTYAVLGCGADICYPRDHIGLYTDILRQGGGILSEYPPGTPPLPYHFPARNRIISGLSDAVLVMEARIRSGSLITADLALEQGKDVYALPGPVDSKLSEGCNRLIAQGAGMLLSVGGLLREWGLEGRMGARQGEENKKVLESTDNMVYSCLGLYPKNIDDIAEETGMEARDIMQSLVSLEMQGYVRGISNNYYVKAK